MKCDNCRASWEINNENGCDGGCYLEEFIDKKDTIQYTDNGCAIHPKTLKSLMDAREKARAADYDAYVKWYEARCHTKETCAICGTETDWGVITRANEEWKQKFYSVMDDNEKCKEMLDILDKANEQIEGDCRHEMIMTVATDIECIEKKA